MTSSIETYAPTVLVVDDDTNMAKMLRRRFHSETSVGVIIASRMDAAREILLDDSAHVDAIVADLTFEGDTADPEHDLNDGIDLLSYARKSRPDIYGYVVSVWADVDSYKERAASLDLEVRDWFQKLEYGMGSNPRAPWTEIERDLLARRLEKDSPALEGRLEALGLSSDQRDQSEVVPEKIRGAIRTPVRTYLQSFESDPGHKYSIRKPIEVICRTNKQGIVNANAIRLGLIQEGEGDDIEEALYDLEDIITDQIKMFEEEKPKNISGYLGSVLERFREYIDM